MNEIKGNAVQPPSCGGPQYRNGRDGAEFFYLQSLPSLPSLLSLKNLEHYYRHVVVTYASLLSFVVAVPFGEVAQSLADGDGGAEVIVAFEGGAVGKGDRHVAWLHGNELLVGIEVVVCG